MAEETATQVPQETQTTQQTQQPQQDQQLSNKFAMLAKREKFIRSKAEEIKAREQEFKTREEKLQKAMDLEKALESDFLQVLYDRGLTPEQIAQKLLEGPQKQDIHLQHVEKKLSSLEEKLTQAQKQDEERQAQQIQQARMQIKNDVKILVESDPVAYESIKGSGSEDAVVELIEQVFNEENRLMSVEEAAKEVEDYLVEEALKLAKLSKIQSKLNPIEEKTQVPVKQTPMTIIEKTPMKTLTQAATTTTSRPLSAKDRRQRAILAFEGKLK